MNKLKEIVLIFGLLCLAGCGEYEVEVTTYNPELAYDGITIFNNLSGKTVVAVDMEGNILWTFFRALGHMIGDFEIQPNGDILCATSGEAFLLRPPDEILWLVDTPANHHSMIMLPNGNLMFLFGYFIDDVEGWVLPIRADGIHELNPYTGEIVWEWLGEDHLSIEDYCPIHTGYIDPGGAHDWSHCNALFWDEEEQSILVNSRHLNRFMKIDYTTGEILWSIGDGGDFGEGLFSHSHDPQPLPDGRFLMFDNGNHRVPYEYSRALEIEVDWEREAAEEVWEYRGYPDFFDYAMGDANRLPNGNTLITSSIHGRLLEVTESGEIAWEMQAIHIVPFWDVQIFKAERIGAERFEAAE